MPVVTEEQVDELLVPMEDEEIGIEGEGPGMPLDAFLFDNPRAELWEPETAEDIEWIMERLASAEAQIKREERNLEKRVKDAKRKYDYYWNKYGVFLERDARAHIGRQKKARSYRYANGLAGLRAKGEAIMVHNQEGAVEYILSRLPVEVQATWEAVQQSAEYLTELLVEHGEGLNFKREQLQPRLADIKSILTIPNTPAVPGAARHAVVKDTGEVVEWADIEPATDTFYLDFTLPD